MRRDHTVGAGIRRLRNNDDSPASSCTSTGSFLAIDRSEMVASLGCALAFLVVSSPAAAQSCPTKSNAFAALADPSVYDKGVRPGRANYSDPDPPPDEVRPRARARRASTRAARAGPGAARDQLLQEREHRVAAVHGARLLADHLAGPAAGIPRRGRRGVLRHGHRYSGALRRHLAPGRRHQQHGRDGIGELRRRRPLPLPRRHRHLHARRPASRRQQFPSDAFAI